MKLRIDRIGTALPAGFEQLALAARAEDVHNMPMLLADWQTGTERFDGVTSALYGAWAGDMLVGVGGMTPETLLDMPAMRMRRFYVHPEQRRSGVASMLAETVMAAGLAHTARLTVNAAASPMAAPFWLAMDFIPIPVCGITHMYVA